MNQYKSHIILMAVTFLLTACTSDQMQDVAERGTINFAVAQQPTIEVTRSAPSAMIVGQGDGFVIEEQVEHQGLIRTRATLDNSTSFSNGTTITLWGYPKTGNAFFTAASKEVNNNSIKTDVDWPVSGEMHFYATYNVPSDKITTPSFGTRPTIAYKDTETDFLYAEQYNDTYQGGTTAQPIPLQFNHITTAVRFVSNLSGTVSKISIKDLKTSGTYNASNTPNWNASGSEEVSFEKDEYYYMVPQQLSNSEIQVICDGTLLTASLKNNNWEAGKAYTYTLKTANPPVGDGIKIFEDTNGWDCGNSNNEAKVVYDKSNSEQVAIYNGIHAGTTITVIAKVKATGNDWNFALRAGSWGEINSNSKFSNNDGISGHSEATTSGEKFTCTYTLVEGDVSNFKSAVNSSGYWTYIQGSNILIYEVRISN